MQVTIKDFGYGHLEYRYEGVGGKHVFSSYDEVCRHTRMRIDNAIEKAKNDKKLSFEEAFDKQMLSRLKKLKNYQKIVCAVTLLYAAGYTDLADRYEAILLLRELRDEWED